MSRILRRLAWRLRQPRSATATQPPLSRREFLQLSALVAGAAALGACQPAAPVEAPLVALHNWPEYVNPDNLKRLETELGLDVAETTFQGNEGLLNDLQVPSAAYDVVVPTDYMTTRLIREKILRPLDHAQLPNLGNVQAKFLHDRSYDPQSVYSVTKNWGTTGLIWNDEVVTEPVQAWADLWALAPKYSGRIVVVEARDEVLGAALKMLGYSFNESDPTRLAEAGRKLLELRPHVAINTDYFKLFADKAAVLSLGWNGDAFIIREEFAGHVQYTVPTEGSLLWEDDWCIPVSASHPKNAHVFINFMLNPEVAAAEANYIGYATVVEPALALLDPAVRDDPSLYPPAEVMAKLEQMVELGGENETLREKIWGDFLKG